MENSRRRRFWPAAVLSTALLLAAAAWQVYRETSDAALAEDFALEVLAVTSSPRSRDQLWTEALVTLAQRHHTTEPQLESRLRRFASGNWLGQLRHGRQGATAEIIEHHWFGAASKAREAAEEQPSFASLHLLGNLAFLLDNTAEARTTLTAALEHSDGAPVRRASAQIRLGQMALVENHPDRARPLAEAAVHTLDSIDPSDDTTLAAGLALSSAIALAENRSDDVESLDLRLINVIERSQSAESPSLVHPLTGLGRVALSRNQLGDAERYLQRAAAIIEKAQLKELSAGTTLSSLGELQRRQGHSQQAEALTLKGLRLIDESPGGPDSMAEAQCLKSLGNTLNDLQRPAEAVQRLERCIEIWTRKADIETPEFADALSELGSTYYELSRFSQSETVQRRAFELLEPKGLIDTPANCKVTARLGRVLLDTNRAEQAEPYLRRACSVLAKYPDEFQPRVIADYRIWLAQAYARQHLTDEAARQLRELIEFCEAHFGSNNSCTVDAYFENARLLLEDNRLIEAEAAFNRTVALAEKLQPAENLQLSLALTGLGHSLRQQKRPSEALRHLRRALTIAQNILGLQNSRTASVLSDYSSALIDDGEPGEAVRLLTSALAVQQHDPSANPVLAGSTLFNLGRAYFELGVAEEAETSLIRSLHIYVTLRKTRGEQLPDEKTVLSTLRQFYESQHLSPDVIEQKLSAAAE